MWKLLKQLLNHAIKSVYSARNVIFEKDTTNFTKNTVYMEWNGDDDLIPICIMTKRLAEIQVIRQDSDRDGKQTGQVAVTDTDRMDNVDN